MENIVLSVHQLVDFLLRKGDIDSRVFNADTMLEGTRIHLRYQSIQDGNYQSEVPLEASIDYEDYHFILQGRADGIIKTNDRYIIDEIKSTNDDLDHFYMSQGEWHLGQAICYAFMYLKMHSLDEIGVRLTYISQIDNHKMIKDFVFSNITIFQKVENYIKDYIKFYSLIANHKLYRIKTSEKLAFPFENYREGQREVAKYVYKVASDGGLFFFEAPTGTGKTMSTLFPSVKTFKDNINDKIFYLSAKNQGKQVAHDAMKILTRHGLDAYSIVLSSREQMCQCTKQKCNPDDCPFAKGYYDKINTVIELILKNEKCINRDIILNYSLLYGICPFECQLDVSSYCDIIICDYNYVFDPLVYLKRFFDDYKKPYFALIDEAHNLAERTKSMYTIALETDKLIALKTSFKHYRTITLKKAINRLLLDIDNINDKNNQYNMLNQDYPLKFYNDLETLFSSMQDILKDHNEYVNDEFDEVFKMVIRFIKIHDYIDENFVFYIENNYGNSLCYIRLVDPSKIIKNTLKKIRGSVIFSATLTPIDYYINTLGGNNETPYLRLNSPFEQKNLCLLVRNDISTTYKDREKSYSYIAESIKAVIRAKIGNYLVFFSSYQYLNNVLEYYQIEDEKVIIQDKDMNINQREEFLANFKDNPTSTTIGFAVLGGVFSEGIDLIHDRLIGAIIVGVGLPQVSFERDLIKNHYDNLGISGFDYAYTNPGKNKVMQAAGRVIRSELDKGVVLLIDQRFTYLKYKDMFKTEWSHYKIVRSSNDITSILNDFWSK